LVEVVNSEVAWEERMEVIWRVRREYWRSEGERRGEGRDCGELASLDLQGLVVYLRRRKQLQRLDRSSVQDGEFRGSQQREDGQARARANREEIALTGEMKLSNFLHPNHNQIRRRTRSVLVREVFNA